MESAFSKEIRKEIIINIEEDGSYRKSKSDQSGAAS
ncbi:hypothetical protein J2W48_000041 [Flavobacterium piscis]|uniref:Transposase n=1 Tax=Flavobacterium piscis TaxID=1114874 RepID=A0ABU1Y379_9FLAO|nr:hypothetical protein [Flavobacterium piscis]